MEVAVGGGDLVGVAENAGKSPEECVGGGKRDPAVRPEEGGHGLEGFALQRPETILQAVLIVGKALGQCKD